MQDSKRPINVVVVMTDDQGYSDLGCTGNPWISTPNIDSFSRQSVRCNDFHVSSYCTPTRGAIMTGRYPMRNGAWATAWGRSILRRDEMTMPEVFRHNGYRTGLFGKWHLGDSYPYRPHDRGYDKVVAHKGGGVGQTPDYWGNDYYDDTYFHNGVPQSHEGYCTDIWFEEAKSFIDDCGDSPFFAFISTNAPHTPYFVDGKYSNQYRGIPEVVHPEFYGMITNIDENFGKLREFLEERNLSENTLLIFMTDNGSSGCGLFDDESFLLRGYNAGMRGQKGSFYDGGHRVPFYARCDALGLTDRDVDELLSHTDMLPTFIDLLDLKVPRNVAFDGLSVADCLRGRETPELSDRPVLVQNSQSPTPPDMWYCAVLKGKWRLVHGTELYNVETDPEQRKNVASDHPEIVKELRSVQEAFWVDVAQELNQPCPHVLGDPAENPTRLDAMDVMGDIAWDQPHILEALNTTGLWSVEVAEAGSYRISLRRWPEELDLPIIEVPKGKDLERSIRADTTGKHRRIEATSARLRIAGVEANKQVLANDKEIVFEIDLPDGLTDLEADFFDNEGKQQGAYYVYVERV